MSASAVTVTPDAIRASLRQCMDPEVPISIVDMGLVYGIDVTDGNDVNVEIVWDPPWSMELLSDEARAALRSMGSLTSIASSPAPIDYATAMPQGVGNLVRQEDGSMVLANEHDQGFMVNQAIVDFWRSCNGQRRITDLVEIFARQTGLQRGQVEKEVMQLVKQLTDGGLLVIPTATTTVTAAAPTTGGSGGGSSSSSSSGGEKKTATS